MWQQNIKKEEKKNNKTAAAENLQQILGSVNMDNFSGNIVGSSLCVRLIELKITTSGAQDLNFLRIRVKWRLAGPWFKHSYLYAKQNF